MRDASPGDAVELVQIGHIPVVVLENAVVEIVEYVGSDRLSGLGNPMGLQLEVGEGHLPVVSQGDLVDRVLQEPDLGVLEQVAVTAGAIYASQKLESSSTMELALDGLVQAGTGEATLTIIAGAAVTSAGAEVQSDLIMELTASAGE